MVAAVGGLEEAAVRAAPRTVFPGAFLTFPHTDVDNVRMVRINLNFRCTGKFVDKKNILKGFAAIYCPVKPTLLIGPIRMPGYCYEDAIGIVPVDCNLTDLLSVAKTEMRPRLAGVNRFVNAVADG